MREFFQSGQTQHESSDFGKVTTWGTRTRRDENGEFYDGIAHLKH